MVCVAIKAYHQRVPFPSKKRSFIFAIKPASEYEFVHVFSLPKMIVRLFYYDLSTIG